MRSASAFPDQVLTHRPAQCLTKNIETLCIHFESTYQWNFANLKNCQNPEIPVNLTLFSDFFKFHF
jgi:hypothetical protein